LQLQAAQSFITKSNIFSFTAHSWLEVASSDTADSHETEVSCFGHLEAQGESLSVSFITRDQDISFGNRSSALISEPQSPTFTCRSSFSAFLVEPSTPDLATGGFSFRSPIPSMPSFTFFSPAPLAEQQEDDHIAGLLGNRESPEASDTILCGKLALCFSDPC